VLVAFLGQYIVYEVYKRSYVGIVQAVSTADKKESMPGEEGSVKDLSELITAETLIVGTAQND
jgi:hypothetical protein